MARLVHEAHAGIINRTVAHGARSCAWTSTHADTTAPSLTETTCMRTRHLNKNY